MARTPLRDRQGRWPAVSVTSRPGNRRCSSSRSALRSDVSSPTARGYLEIFRAAVFDCCDPYWRVENPDGDWEELTKREVTVGIGVAARPSPSA